MTARTIAVGGTAYPLILPNIRDPRLHVAAVIITIHVLGQVALGFHVSIPQILAAILTCAIIEVTLTFRQSRAFVWPASAMLTGSGVALILRVVGHARRASPGTSTHWYVFAGVAGLLAPDQVRHQVPRLARLQPVEHRARRRVRRPRQHADRAARLLVGRRSTSALLAAYAVIIGGGLLITRRLRLLALAATFWLALSIGLGLLAGSGHCMTANWAFAPVCGFDFWRVDRDLARGPDLPVLHDHRPQDRAGRAGRAGRVRHARRRREHAPDGAPDRRVRHQGRAARGPGRDVRRPPAPRPGAPGAQVGGRRVRPLRDAARDRRAGAGAGAGAWRRSGSGSIVVAVLGIGVGIVAAGAPARGTSRRPGVGRDPRPASRTQVDPARSPPSRSSRTSSTSTTRWPARRPRQLVLTLAENLELENQALLRARRRHPDRGGPRRPARRDAGSARQAAAAAGTTTIDRIRDRRREHRAHRPVRATGRPEHGPRVARAR